MRPAKAFRKGSAAKLKTALKQAKTKSEFQRIQCLWLRVSLGLNADQVAQAVGWLPTSVRRLQAQYLKKGEPLLESVGRGGRRHQNLTREEEQDLLEQFTVTAQQGGMLEVSQVKLAYEKAVGHGVPKSTVYRMLARQGWRKIVPRPHHPQLDTTRQQAFKKNCPRWSPKFSGSSQPKPSDPSD